MDFKILLFILMLLAAFIAPYAFLYITVRHFFSLKNKGPRRLLLISLSCLSVSFFIAAMMSRMADSWFTRGLNYLAMLWQGYFIYFILAALLLWSIAAIARFFHLSLPRKTIALLIFILAFIYSTYGAIHGRRLVNKKITVKIDHLPEHWENETIVHLTDVHLGSIIGPGYLRRLIKRINRIDPALVLITGDLFDGMNGNVNRFIPMLKKLTARKGVYFVTGNHEGYLGLKEPLTAIKKTAIILLDNEIKEVEGLQLVGIGFPEYDKPQQIDRLFLPSGPYNRNKPAILLFHTPTGINGRHDSRSDQQFNTYWTPDRDFSYVRNLGIDLQLSGHTHAGQLWPFGLLTRLIFGPFHYGLHQDGRFSIYTSSGTGTWGPPMRTGSDSELVIITLKKQDTP